MDVTLAPFIFKPEENFSGLAVIVIVSWAIEK